MLDTREVPIVDSHCHPFDPERESGSLSRQFSMSLVPNAAGVIESTVLVHRIVQLLSEVLDCEPTYESVESARRTAYTSDRKGYVQRLFKSANIDIALLDTGYPSKHFTGYSVDLVDFGSLIPCQYRIIHRIEPELEELLELKLPFDEFADRFRSGIDAAVGQGAVGMKSAIAYWTGIEVGKPTVTMARQAYDRVQLDRPGGIDEKTLRDWAFVEALRKGIEHNIPLQIHTGMGDGPDFNMRLAHPILLRDVVIDDELKHGRIVLTHGGYPWVEETGWMTNQFDNVFADLSEMIPYGSHGIKTKLIALLEMAPTSKLMYGSDAVKIPERYWFAALEGRRAISDALAELVATAWLDERAADEIARRILRENALDVYRLH